MAIFLGKTFQAITCLNKPLVEDNLEKKSYSWDSKSSINLAVKSTSVSVLSFNPVDKSIVILNIPQETYFTLPRGFGSWSVESIYGLGQEEKPQIGPGLLKESLSKLLGLKVDDFLVTDKTDSLDQIIASWRKNPLNIIAFIKDSKTDLTPLEALSLFRAMSGVRPDKITYLDISTSNITESKLLPDSTRVLGVDSINLDLFVREHMSDPNILGEGISVGIFNSTNHPGLGQEE